MQRRHFNQILALVPLLMASHCRAQTPQQQAAPASLGMRIVEAARSQIGVTTAYDPAYTRLNYPGGDVPRERGVCTDVVIRALRDAGWGDLQQLVHEDMRAHFSAYPRNWGASRPDPSIDHRRVPNLRSWFSRRGFSLKVSGTAPAWQPGDLATTMLGARLPHIMIVSDRKTRDGTPLVLHNIGSGTKEEDFLLANPPDGHYRLK